MRREREKNWRAENCEERKTVGLLMSIFASTQAPDKWIRHYYGNRKV